MHEEWGEKGLLHEQQASDIADIYKAAGIEPIPGDYDKPVKFGMGQTSAPIPGEPLAPRSELPPDAPTAFEKGQTYYDFTNYFRPVRWSESKQAWIQPHLLSAKDWKFQNSLHEPAVGAAAIGNMKTVEQPGEIAGGKANPVPGGTDVTAWWHGSQHMQPALMPAGYGGSIHAVWVASDQATSHMFSGGDGTITRVYIKPGKYFDFRDPEQVEHAAQWLRENKPTGAGATSTMPKVGVNTLIKEFDNAHYQTMQRPEIQAYLKANGYDGYFEREQLRKNTPVNLAVYNADKIIRGQTTKLTTQVARIGRWEGSYSPHEPEEMERPGTLLAAYEHGKAPEPGTTKWLGERPTAGEGEPPGEGGTPPGAEPPEEPPSRLSRQSSPLARRCHQRQKRRGA